MTRLRAGTAAAWATIILVAVAAFAALVVSVVSVTWLLWQLNPLLVLLFLGPPALVFVLAFLWSSCDL